MRGPMGLRVGGAEWSQCRWVGPCMTSSEPGSRTMGTDTPPRFGRRRNRRGAPKLADTMTGAEPSSGSSSAACQPRRRPCGPPKTAPRSAPRRCARAWRPRRSLPRCHCAASRRVTSSDTSSEPAPAPRESRQPRRNSRPACREPEAQLRRRGEAVPERREAVAEPHIQAPPRQKAVVLRAAVVRRKPGKRAALEQRVRAARGLPAHRLRQRQARTPAAFLPRLPGERAREPCLAEARRVVVHQAPAPEIDGETPLGVRPGDAAADIHPEAGFGVAAVLAQPDLDARRQRRPALEAERPRALEAQPQPRHLGARVRKPRHRRRARAHPHRVGLRRKLEAACLGWRLHQRAAQAHCAHR